MRTASKTHPTYLLLEEEEDYRRFLDDQARTIRFFEGLGKPLSTREIEILAEEEKRMCVECQHFAAGRFSSYCHEFHRPREVKPGDRACEWFGRRG